MTQDTNPAVTPGPAAPGRLDFIDGLRGLAMMMVLLFHCWTFGGRWHVNVPLGRHAVNLCAPLAAGHVGVGLFLVLSGFCLYWPFVKAGAGREPTLREFAARRCRRILPPYYVALAIYGGVALWRAAAHRPGDAPLHAVLESLALHVVMLHNMRPQYFFDLNGSFWSLALEVHLYVFFPVFVEMFRRCDARRVVLVALIAVSAFRLLAVHVAQATDGDWVNVLTYSVFGRCLEFLLGMYAAQRLARQRAGGGALGDRADAAVVAAVVGLALAGRHHGLLDVCKAALSGFAFTALLLAASRPGARLNRWLSSRPLVRLGVFSYSVYLVHQPLALALGGFAKAHHFTNAASLAFGLLFVVPLLLGLGYLFHLAFERPFLSPRARRAERAAPGGAGSAPPAGRSRSVARNVTTTLAAQIVSWGLTFLVTLFLPRYIGARGLGAITLAGSFAAVFGLMVSLGTSTVLIKEIARDRRRVGELTVTALAARLPLGLLAVGLGGGAAALLGYGPSLRGLIVVSLLAMVAGQVGDVFGSALRGLEEIPRQNAAAVAEKVALAALTVALVALRAPLWALVAAGLAAALVPLGMNAAALWDRVYVPRPPGPAQLRALTAAGLPFLTTSVFVAVYGQADALLLSKMSGLAAIGWYGLAKRLGGTTLMIPTTLTGVMLPTLARVYREDEAAFAAAVRRLFNLMFICVVPFSVVLILAPGQVLSLLHYPPSFRRSVPVLVLMGAAMILWYLSQAAGTALIACDRQAALSRITGVSALCSVPLCAACVFLAQHRLGNGALGAMASDVLIEAYMVAAYIRALPVGLFTWRSFGVLWRATAAALPLIGLFYAVRDRSGLLLLVPGLLAYLPLCGLMRCLHPQDWQMVQSLFRRRVNV